MSNNGYQPNGNGRHKAAPAPVISPDDFPYSQDAERAVLGSLIIDPDVYGYVRPIVAPEDFYLHRHQWVYQDILTLIEDGEYPDLMNIADRLDRRERAPDGGWQSYVIGLINEVPTSQNAPSYARIVQEYAVRRRLILAGQQMAISGHNLSMPLDEALAGAEAAALNLRGLRADSGVKTSTDISRSFLSRVEFLREQDGKLPGLATGFTDLDRTIDGLEAQPWLLASRPGMGKSSLSLAIALNCVLRQQKKVFIFSLEMSENQLMNRAVAAETGIPLKDIRKPRYLNDMQMKQVYETTGRISQSHLYVDATPGATPSQIRAKALRKVMELGGLDLVIIDHLHIMSPDVQGLTGNALVTHLSKEVMKLPKLLGCPVLYLAQLNRNLEMRADKHPSLADLRDSGSLEEDAYGVLFIYRDDYYNKETSERPRIAEIICAKNRDGEPGTCELYWQGELTTFRNLHREQVTL